MDLKKKCGEIKFSKLSQLFEIMCVYCSGKFYVLDIFSKHFTEEHLKDLENEVENESQIEGIKDLQEETWSGTNYAKIDETSNIENCMNASKPKSFFERTLIALSPKSKHCLKVPRASISFKTETIKSDTKQKDNLRFQPKVIQNDEHVTKNKKYFCEMCGKGYTQKNSLNVHIRTHTGEKPFKCNRCNSTFASSRYLKTHEVVHTGLKPAVCDTCGMGFTTAGSLREHKRIHTGEMPYQCKYCPRKFRILNSLKVHERSHTGEKPFSCDICKKSYTAKVKLKRHNRLIHENTGEVKEKKTRKHRRRKDMNFNRSSKIT